jgi:hypothetical protein
MNLAPQHGISGSKLKISLGEDQAKIHGNQMNKRSKE